MRLDSLHLLVERGKDGNPLRISCEGRDDSKKKNADFEEKGDRKSFRVKMTISPTSPNGHECVLPRSPASLSMIAFALSIG